MYKLICQKPAHFLSAQIAVMNSFLLFVALGIHNFGHHTTEIPFHRIWIKPSKEAEMSNQT